MVKFYFKCLLALASVAATSFAASLPSTFPRCYLKQKDYGTCLKHAIEASFQVLANGIPALGVLPIDPMVVTEMTLAQGSGPVNIELNFKNTSIFGFKDSIMTKVGNEFLAGGTSIHGDLVIPRFNMVSQYNIKGRILLLPIHGQGQSNITILQLRAVYKMENEIIKKKNGQEYIKVNNFDLKLTPGKSYISFENLFDGDKRLSDQMNVILSENANDIVNELRPSIEETFGEICRHISFKLFQNVPYKTIFPLDAEE